MVPNLAGFTLSHFIANFLRQSTRTMKFSFLNTLYTRGSSLTKCREGGELAILQALGQAMPYRLVIKSYTAWILPTPNIKGRGHGKNTTV